MAVTKEQVLAAVSEYREANSRPCPARYLVEKFGEEVTPVIKELKEAGTLIGQRGRTGGLVETSTVASAEVETDDAGNIISVNDTTLADQFAELAAKLADDSANAATA